ncbi:MAG: hypothetical protein A3E88_08135 [Legionellales bacterium RIFCSPHIGHO2_12_FULL_35_11]|nr:MAG: hypothetical protein A3E88_08135 [Legionellales bacterium RIFCSPHIGHO2_12_FULL_35_11]
MYDLQVLEKARLDSAILDMPFLEKQRLEVKKIKPFLGLNILHNIPLTYATAFKIEVLALAGANVCVTAPNGFPVEERAVQLLKSAGFRVDLRPNTTEIFDIHLDCCAELLKNTSPTLGAVELTQSGSVIYQTANPDYPVVSVDDSKLKVLETFFGTGDGFSRAMQQLVGDDKTAKPFVIFGNGKVGKGILYVIRKFTDKIFVIDIKERLAANSPEVTYIDASDIDAVKNVIKHSYCCITATGKRHLLTGFYSFSKADFGDAILVNMGAEDEYGDNFAVTDVEFNKQPFNFSLNEPTAFRYLDPIFYAHNIGINLILSNTVKKAYNAFPDNQAVDILEKWQAIYQEPLAEALLSF